MSDPDWRERHSRHLLIPGMDGQRQQQLMNSSVGIFGRSPMAEPLLDTLARGGIAHLGIATDEALES
ncbi:MAG: hypothetical protein HQL81_16210, partial [Magnetococcales bacterium]|nr:hypothetical protein [Magnetococcales bacterium]